MVLGSLKDAVKSFHNPEESTTAVTETTSQNEVFKMNEASERLFELCNQACVDKGLSPLVLDENICRVAYTRCNEQFSLLGHTRPNGEKFYTAFYEHGLRFSSYGENIVIIRSSVESFEQRSLDLWLCSDFHKVIEMYSSETESILYYGFWGSPELEKDDIKDFLDNLSV